MGPDTKNCIELPLAWENFPCQWQPQSMQYFSIFNNNKPKTDCVTALEKCKKLKIIESLILGADTRSLFTNIIEYEGDWKFSFRNSPAVTMKNGEIFTVYPSPRLIGQNLVILHGMMRMSVELQDKPSDVIRLAISCFLYFVCIHPLTDGNGRIGRLLLQVVLASGGLLDVPVLNLKAPMHANRQAFIREIAALHQEGRWEGILDFMDYCLIHAVRALASPPPQP